VKTCVLDANALLSYLQDRPGSSRVGQLMKEAANHERLLLMSVINWGEVFYSIWRSSGEHAARELMGSSTRFPVELVPVDLASVMAAAELKARHKLPYADSFAAAVAVARNATLVTADPHFQKLGKRVAILWLSRP
jgi:predicted nucleic acid-binding protein